ncbi:hypothetical protein ACFL2D_01485 [Patescibacteria group bacterium]
MIQVLVPLLIISLSVIYYFLPDIEFESFSVFLSISTFIFSIFIGFMISRQGKRYSEIRSESSKFDGEMSAIYRDLGHLGKKPQEKGKEIIKNHYTKILKEGWDYHLTHKSSTITDMHEFLDKIVGKRALAPIENIAVLRVMVSLERLQAIRKDLIALSDERIPMFQWMIIYVLVAVLFLTLSMIPAEGFVIGAILKSAFGSAVIFIVILLHSFENLRFFNHSVREQSAQDVLNIFKGTR